MKADRFGKDQQKKKQDRNGKKADRSAILSVCLIAAIVCSGVILYFGKSFIQANEPAAETETAAGKTPAIAMYRLYNPNSSEHFYTANPAEKSMLVTYGWQYEGIGWYAPQDGDPVYRLYNPNAGDHHYTLSAAERDALVAKGWRYEQIGWQSDPQKRVSVYRQYNPNAKFGAHNFTTAKQENDALVALGWRAEGIGWYAQKEGVPVDNSLKALHVEGSRLLDENNREVVLQGYSTFGLNYMPEYVDPGVFSFVKNQMHGQAIRLALYTQESGGYCSGGNQAQLEELIDRGVKLAKTSGVYAIIDWHILSDGNPLTHLDEAKTFFSKMAARYKNEKHVLYEICNEPNSVDWKTIKNYADQIIPVIRAQDQDGVILVGTPTWSQDVDLAAADPLKGYSNIMYTLHFYAATHKDGIRNKLKAAHAAGLPVFVSEFGISSADGNGPLDLKSANEWIALLDEYKISRIGWALSNKNEASALFVPSSSLPLSLSDLSQAGRWFEQTYRSHTADTPADQQPEEPSKPVPSNPEDPGDTGTAEYTLEQSGSWQSGGRTFTQYVLHVRNTGSQTLKTWKARLEADRAFRVENSWNASLSMQGQILEIVPLAWNAKIEAGGEISSVGLILSSNGELHIRADS